MKFITAIIFTIVFSFSIFAQSAMETLATFSGRSLTAQDVSPEIADAWLKLPSNLAKLRKSLLEQHIEKVLLEVEADKQNVTVGKLLETEVSAKVPNPPDEEIKKIYEANRIQLGNPTFEKVRPQILFFLRQAPEKKVYEKYIESLRSKYKIVPVKDVNTNNLIVGDVLAIVDSRNITYADFIKENGLVLYEFEANAFDAMKRSLEQVVDAALYSAEAQSLGISTTTYISREITDKLKDYSDDEIESLGAELRKNLYPKYRVRYFLNEPKPFIQNISTDDDPSLGNENAKVTVVMFTDFQCPACSGFYPVIKNVIAEYGDNIRLVVRDFPLVNTHENAFQSAIAANAANKQGKFFEYKELLYKNQKSLDTESLIKYAGEIGLNVKKFENDLNDEKFADEVRKDMADGKSYGVRGTPSIFVNGYKLRSLSAKGLRQAIEKSLK